MEDSGLETKVSKSQKSHSKNKSAKSARVPRGKIARDTQGIRKGYETQRNISARSAQGQRNIR